MLVDNRFEWGVNKNGISKWLRNNIQLHPDFDKFFKKLKAFYCQMDA